MRRGKAIVLVLVVAGAVGLGCWKVVDLASARAPAAAPPPAVPVNAAPVRIANVPATVPALGTVQSIDTVNLMPQVNGRIMAIYFKQGDQVTAGQPLFLIDPRPYQAILDQAQGQLAHDQAALAEAKMDLARYQRLTAENSIATQTEQDQIYVVGQDQGTVKLDEANVATATINLAYCHIDAPVAGLTGALQVDLGNYVQAASSAQPSTNSAQPSTTTAAPSGGVTPLVTITQMQPIYVSFSVPQTQLDTIRENQAKGALEVDAYSPAGKLIDKGKLTLISNQVATATGTIMLEGTFANQQERLWPNQFVGARLIEFIRPNVITVPAAAVMTGPNGPYVYVIGAANKVSQVDVEVTATQDNIAVIGKGLKAGEEVVTNGQYRLDNGVAVSIQAPKVAAAG
ncbi:MAG TPA: efflux RND transporter periplasmic adaptor subunit [Stellaceae bacterium]|nr:efflux RND transporter periplasmic adaptor subunit [Stellaceae bacterium]